VLAATLTAVAPVALATALIAQAHTSVTPAPHSLTRVSTGAADAPDIRADNTTEQVPGEPAQFRSKKTTPPAPARLVPAAGTGGDAVARGVRLGTATTALIGVHRCSPGERGPPRRTCDEVTRPRCPGTQA
jgi:hypothetical protein